MIASYARWQPEDHGTPRADVLIRPVRPHDVPALARVMAARGGAPETHTDAAALLLDRAPVLLLAVAEDGGGDALGWSGALQTSVHPGEHPVWLTAGLTVVPQARRAGVGLRLLHAVAEAVRTSRIETGPLHSVVNTRNRASLALHARAGFQETASGPRFAGIEFDGGDGVVLRRR